MNEVRAELETRLKSFADARSIKIAYEGKHFDKPTTTFLECMIVARDVRDVTTDGSRQRQRGVFQVNVWTPTGGPVSGSGTIETIAYDIASAFPVVPKTGNVSVEKTPDVGMIITDVTGWLVLPVIISYRYES